MPGRGRMHIEHVDLLATLERGKADRRAVHHAEQRELAHEPRGELLLVVGHGDPGPALAIAVVLGGELIDAGAEDLGDDPDVGGEKRPQREFWVGGGGHGRIRLSGCVEVDVCAPRAANSIPSPPAGEGGRERSERPGEGSLTSAPSPASRLRRPAPSPTRTRACPSSAL